MGKNRLDLPDPSINIRPAEEQYTKDSDAKRFWSGEKEIKNFAGVSGVPTVLLDIGHLPKPEILTVDVLSDLALAGDGGNFVAGFGQRASVFTMEIGIGRITWLQRIGARTANSPNPPFFNTNQTPPIRSMRLTILAQSLRILALKVPTPVFVPGLPPQVDRATATIGAWTPEAFEERICFQADLGTIAQSVVAVPLMLAEPWGREDRRGVIIYNDSPDSLLIGYGFNPLAGLFNFPIIPFERWEMQRPIFPGQVNGIWPVAGAGSARVTVLRDAGIKTTY